MWESSSKMLIGAHRRKHPAHSLLGFTESISNLAVSRRGVSVNQLNQLKQGKLVLAFSHLLLIYALPKMRLSFVPQTEQMPWAIRRPESETLISPSKARFSLHFTQYAPVLSSSFPTYFSAMVTLLSPHQLAMMLEFFPS